PRRRGHRLRPQPADQGPARPRGLVPRRRGARARREGCGRARRARAGREGRAARGARRSRPRGRRGRRGHRRRSSMNIVILAGRLGADPELKYANSGTAILNLRLATKSYRKGADGEGEKVTYWHTLTMFGRRAESLANILQKGTGITVRGE